MLQYSDAISPRAKRPRVAVECGNAGNSMKVYTINNESFCVRNEGINYDIADYHVCILKNIATYYLHDGSGRTIDVNGEKVFIPEECMSTLKTVKNVISSLTKESVGHAADPF